MKTTWIITSALNTSAGVFDAKARVAQTHETMNSILDVYPDPYFVLVEGGKPLQENVPGLSELRARCHLFVDMAMDERIAWLHSNVFDAAPETKNTGGLLGVAKSVSETTLISVVVDALVRGDAPAELRDVGRIFKISGRYQLSPLFDRDAYAAVGDRCVFLKRRPTWMEDARERIGVTEWFSSRLWSFGPSRLAQVGDKLRLMLRDLYDIGLRQCSYVDVEHLLFKYFRDDNPVELEHTHVMGNMGPSGRILYD